MKQTLLIFILILIPFWGISQDFPSFNSEDSLPKESPVFKKYHKKFDFIVVYYHKYHKSEIIKYYVIGYKSNRPKKRVVKYKVNRKKTRGRIKFIWWWDNKNYMNLPTEMHNYGLFELDIANLNRLGRNNEDGSFNAIRLFNRETYYFEIIHGDKYLQKYSYCPQEYKGIFPERNELKIFVSCIDIFNKYWYK